MIQFVSVLVFAYFPAQVPTTMVPHKRSAAESAQMFENMQKKIEDVSWKCNPPHLPLNYVIY